MTRACVAAVAAIVACGTPPRPQPVAERATADAGVAAVEPPADAAVAFTKPGTPRARIEAPHGGTITTLAASADGRVAITADDLGGVRLWPALDGTREPCLVDIARPKLLAIGGDARGFVVAAIDGVGALSIHVIDTDGVTKQRTLLPLEPAYRGAVVTQHGVVAWRSDERMQLVTADGAIAADLAAEPGQRIATVAIAGARAVAVVERSGIPKRRARWLTVGAKLAWGAWIDTSETPSTIVALSPDASRMATLVRGAATGTGQVLVFDTATGALVATSPADAVSDIAMPSNQHVAAHRVAHVQWTDLSRKLTPKVNSVPAPHFVRDTPTIAPAADGAAVMAVTNQLLIAKPTSAAYLGYAMRSPTIAAAAPGGRILVASGHVTLLDDALADHANQPVVPARAEWSVMGLRWLHGTHWLVMSQRHEDGRTTIDLVDSAAGTSKRAIARELTAPPMMAHHPSTNLVTLSFGRRPEVLRYVPAKRALETVVTPPKLRGFERWAFVPVDPALAGGTQLVAASFGTQLTVRWLRDPNAVTKGPSITLDGSYAGADATGRVYVWQTDPKRQLELGMYRDGKLLGTMKTDGPTSLWPDPTGTRLVQVTHLGVGMYGLDGKPLWSVPFTSVTQVLWLDDGAIVLVTAAGIVRVDAATGAVRAARCGWGFGLSPNPHPAGPSLEPVCTAMP